MIDKAWIARGAGASALFLFIAGCSAFESVSGEPERAYLTVDQSSSPTLELTTSLNFLVTQGNVLSFEDLSVDTVSVPFNQEYDIREHLRFYVLATNIEDQTISFRMRVRVDDRTWYNEEKSLEPGETAQFVYRYSAPPLY